jgi:hypothetical protein
LARIILSHALLESIRFVMSRKERRDIYGLINIHHLSLAFGFFCQHPRQTPIPRHEVEL